VRASSHQKQTRLKIVGNDPHQFLTTGTIEVLLALLVSLGFHFLLFSLIPSDIHVTAEHLVASEDRSSVFILRPAQIGDSVRLPRKNVSNAKPFLIHSGFPQNRIADDIGTLGSINAYQPEATPPIYLEPDQVDYAARPVGEWVINTQLWPIGQRSKVKVKLWISSIGAIDKWEVIEAEPSELVAKAGLEPLNETLLNPALAGGVPVASIQFLEFVVDRQ
jgi:hypothetical protein